MCDCMTRNKKMSQDFSRRRSMTDVTSQWASSVFHMVSKSVERRLPFKEVHSEMPTSPWSKSHVEESC
jgi:hypothetical protein